MPTVRSSALGSLPLRLVAAALVAALLAVCTVTAVAQTPQQAVAQSQYPVLPTEFSTHFAPPAPNRSYTVRTGEIPMRDGTKLNTVILISKGVMHAGIALDRTPYNASGRIKFAARNPLLQVGFICVYQHVRGKYGSEGDYIMNRYVRGPLNPTPVSDATDAYDTIG